MDNPAEFSGRVYQTRLSGLHTEFKRLDQIRKDWQGVDVDVVYKNLKPIIVLVFPTQEDCLAFTLKHGKEYV